MSFRRPATFGNPVTAVLLFFPTAVSLLFSLVTFVVGIGFDVIGLTRMSEVILRVSGYVFSFVFLPLSQQSGLFKNFQGRQGSSAA
jgi:hypothetical protein